jgi:transcriptional regulator GlxA family with amidase domain
VVGCGIARGWRVTTHHDFIRALRDQGGAEVAGGIRFVRDRNVVSAVGVMSGIEMSLWLVGELYGGAVAERTESYIAYDFPLRTTSLGIIR